jgi:hypothetical protein
VPSREFNRFDKVVRKIMSVSHEELKRREAEYQRERATHPKRGPKPKQSMEKQK